MYLNATLALVLILVAIWVRWRRKQLTIFKQLGIPGPEPNIICGNMFEIYRKGPIVCWNEWSKKYGRVYGYYLGFKPILYVSDTDLLKKIQIKDFQSFIDRPAFFGEREATKGTLGAALTNEQSARWKELRSILTPSFTTSRMKSMTPLMHSAVEILLSKLDDKATSGKEFDIFDIYQMLTLDVIGRAAFGITTNVQEEEDSLMLRLGRIVFSGSFQSPVILLGVSFPELVNLTLHLRRIRAIFLNSGKHPAKEMISFVKKVIQQRRENPNHQRSDLLQLMLDARVSEEDLKKDDNSLLTAGDDNPDKSDETVKQPYDNSLRNSKRLTDEEILANAIVFFLAGYETTSNLLSYATYLLAKYPEEQEKVRQEVLDLLEREGQLDYGSVNQLKCLDRFISESLRVYPPVLFFVNREAVVDVTYGELHIPKGMTIQVPVYNLHHDPEFWDEPEVFNPDRFAPENRSKINSMAYQPFGAGPRNCIGMRFAQMEAKIALAHVVRNFRLELSPRYDKEPLKLHTTFLMLTPAEGVHLKAIRRQRDSRLSI